MTLENLLYDLDNSSYIDIKLGSSTTTKGSGLSKSLIRDIIDQDYTTSYQHGFTICGMLLKDPKTGNPRNGEKYGKGKQPSDIIEAQDYLDKFFKYRNSYDYDAIDFV